MKRTTAFLFGLGVAVVAIAGRPLMDDRAVMDSLPGVRPRYRATWLRERGMDNSYYVTFQRPESTGLKVEGRWPWGLCWETCGRDSLLFLGSGSGVRILSVTDSVHPRMVGQIAARGLVYQLVVQDSLLFVACGNWGAQVYSVGDPANPRELGSMDAVIGDLCVQDTLCYTLGGDSLRIYDVVNPAQPVRLGALRDSGAVLAVTNGYAFTGTQSAMYVTRVTDPAHPQRVATRSGNYFALFARRNLLFQASYDPQFLAILDVSNPLAITQVSRLDGVTAQGIYVDEQYAYLGYSGFHVVDVSDSAHPVLKGSGDYYDEEGEPFVFRPATYAYLPCRFGGLKVIDIHDVSTPRETTTCYAAGMAWDISLSGGVGCVASGATGLNTVDFSDPAQPHDLGWLGVIAGRATETRAVSFRDSFAYAGWMPFPYLRTVAMADPANPQLAAACSTFNPAAALVLRDSFLYVAEDNRFQVVNVARPRAPVVVGTCAMGNHNWGVTLQDTFAYVGSWDGLIIVNVARPSAPFVVSTTGGTRTTTYGVAVRDTFCYIPSGYETLWVYSIANPAAPYPIAGAPLGADNWGYDATMFDDTSVFVGGKRSMVLVDVGDPEHPRVVGSYPAPSWVRRVLCSPPYLYACCTDAGVMILETTAVGLQEPCGVARPQPMLRVVPSPAGELVHVRLGEPLDGGCWLGLYDACGRRVLVKPIGKEALSVELRLTGLSPGLYFVRIETKTGILKSKMVKR